MGVTEDAMVPFKHLSKFLTQVITFYIPTSLPLLDYLNTVFFMSCLKMPAIVLNCCCILPWRWLHFNGRWSDLSIIILCRSRGCWGCESADRYNVFQEPQMKCARRCRELFALQILCFHGKVPSYLSLALTFYLFAKVFIISEWLFQTSDLLSGGRILSGLGHSLLLWSEAVGSSCIVCIIY